jgi:hypothetical protein
VHYANPLPDTDSSGVLMHYTTTPELADIQNYANVVAVRPRAREARATP